MHFESESNRLFRAYFCQKHAFIWNDSTEKWGWDLFVGSEFRSLLWFTFWEVLLRRSCRETDLNVTINHLLKEEKHKSLQDPPNKRFAGRCLHLSSNRSLLWRRVVSCWSQIELIDLCELQHQEVFFRGWAWRGNSKNWRKTRWMRVTWHRGFGDPLGAGVQGVEDCADLLAVWHLSAGEREKLEEGAQEERSARWRANLNHGRRTWGRTNGKLQQHQKLQEGSAPALAWRSRISRLRAGQHLSLRCSKGLITHAAGWNLWLLHLRGTESALCADGWGPGCSCALTGSARPFEPPAERAKISTPV